MAGVVIYIVSIGLGAAEIVYGGNVGLIGGIIRTIAGVVIPAYLNRKGPKEFFRETLLWVSIGLAVATIFSRLLPDLTQIDS